MPRLEWRIDRRPSLVAFCADEKELVVAFLGLGYDMKRPELVTLFGGRQPQCADDYSSTAIGRAPTQAERFGPGPYGLGTCIRSRSLLLSYTQLGASFH
jgi:hypothetical protein